MTDEKTPETPQEPNLIDLIAPAPEDVRAITGRIDDALAERLFMVASTSKTGASNGKVYPSAEDETFKKDSRTMRLHLASRLDPDTKRARIVKFAPKGKAGVSFAVQIVDKKERKPKKEKDAPAASETK